jgi:hypothetical protein
MIKLDQILTILALKYDHTLKNYLVRMRRTFVNAMLAKRWLRKSRRWGKDVAFKRKNVIRNNV